MKGCMIVVIIITILLGCLCGAIEWFAEFFAGMPSDFYICLGLLAFIIICIRLIIS